VFNPSWLNRVVVKNVTNPPPLWFSVTNLRVGEVASDGIPILFKNRSFTADGVSSMKNSGGSSNSIRILIADSSRIHTQLLSDILQRSSDFELITWDQNRTSLVPTAIAEDVHVLAVSSTLNGRLREGLDVIRELRAVHPTSKVVLLVDSHQDDLVVDSLRAGAKGIFNKDSSLEMLRKCLLSVHRGEVWVDGKGMSLALSALTATPSAPTMDPKRLKSFSQREREVVEWLVQGFSNREVADRMGLSQHTIKNYVFRIFEKVGVSSRAELSFLILSQNNGQEILSPHNGHGSGTLQSSLSDVSQLIQDAETGSASDALALAQFYRNSARRQDVLNAYKWYRVASERISQAQSVLANNMTADEIQECERGAKGHFSRSKHVPGEDLNPKSYPARRSLMAG
jgi:DNA-binding NarL/FixJ family response regulator